jgi:predicted Zn-dependent protease
MAARSCATGRPTPPSRCFSRQRSATPVDPAAFAEYAAIAEKHNHFEEARDALVSYHGLVGDDAGFAARALKIGQLSLRINEEMIALPWLQRAAAATPNDVRVLAALADAQDRTGDKDGARASLARGLEIDPANADLHALSRRLR